jgi:hypothetical protein
MTVELAAPPKVTERRRYGKIIEKIVAANGEWVRLTQDEVAPNMEPGVKQSRLWQAAKLRGHLVQTTFQAEALYVRLQKEGA